MLHIQCAMVTRCYSTSEESWRSTMDGEKSWTYPSLRRIRYLYHHADTRMLVRCLRKLSISLKSHRPHKLHGPQRILTLERVIANLGRSYTPLAIISEDELTM